MYQPPVQFGYDIDSCDRDITNEGFALSLQGSLTNAGPLDALIEFVDPVTYVLSAPGFTGAYIKQGNVGRS
jgi:hypothetical protein